MVPDDVHAMAAPVLAHRLVLGADAQTARRSADDLVHALVQRVPVPQDPAARNGAPVRRR